MMIKKAALTAFLSTLAVGMADEGHERCSVPGTMTCQPIGGTGSSETRALDDPPVLDGDASEWADVVGGINTKINNIWGKNYDMGEGSFKCVYDTEKIYFALEIPGMYRFDGLDNKKCAAIGTMMKIGEKAGYLNMGGCPDVAETGCPDGIPATCDDYVVDLGAHWELRETEAGVEYPMDATLTTGDYPVINLDDEYGAGPFCRPDDDDANAGNEWAGAWSHSNPVEGEDGIYTFELSRLLTTPSNVSDAQLEPGETYDFGIAYWDPFQTDFGWTAAGHYLTGCSATWIDLTLAPDVQTAPVENVVTCEGPTELICDVVETAPTLDGNLDDWSNVEGVSSALHNIFGKIYEFSESTFKCVHDGEMVYFSMEIPGDYRFDSAENKKCASIGTMMKMGSKAGYINMGGCEEALQGCADGVPAECDDYRVDLGAHWELKTTTAGELYSLSRTTPGTGDDAVANLDDEYAVSPYCRPDDDDANAGNEWIGAWSHSNPVDGEFGVYRFEIARSLSTPSSTTDKQMAPGETYEFGVAFWDPYETSDAGWAAWSHYSTGCSAEWMNLKLISNSNSSGFKAELGVLSMTLALGSLIFVAF